MTSKNGILFDVFLSEVWPRCYPTDLPPPLGFTAITDHPRVGEVRPGCGLQFGAAPIIIPIVLQSRAVESAGGGRFAVRLPLLLFLSGPLGDLGKFLKSADSVVQ
jgi:hypothetical protein